MARQMLVQVRGIGERRNEPSIIWVYLIHEGEQGVLRWEIAYTAMSTPVEGQPVYSIARVGNMALTEVRGYEAEALTGLNMPAAMDRLREMLHDSVEAEELLNRQRTLTPGEWPG